MASPAKRNEKEYIKNPLSVKSSSSRSYPTKIRESGRASASPSASMPTENIPVSTMLFRKSPCSSPWFPAP